MTPPLNPPEMNPPVFYVSGDPVHYYLAVVITGFLANHELVKDAMTHADGLGLPYEPEIAERCYQLAEAMAKRAGVGK